MKILLYPYGRAVQSVHCDKIVAPSDEDTLKARSYRHDYPQ